MNRLFVTAFLFLLGMELNAQTYQLSFMEVYRNNQIISKGALDVDKLVIDENVKKISIIPSPDFKTQIFKIIRRTTQDDEVIYYCEMINPNGVVQITLILDKFYKFLVCIGEGESGNYVKYYFK